MVGNGKMHFVSWDSMHQFHFDLWNGQFAERFLGKSRRIHAGADPVTIKFYDKDATDKEIPVHRSGKKEKPGGAAG